jgi:hypothetical protein
MTARTFMTEIANTIDVIAAVASTNMCVFGSIRLPQIPRSQCVPRKG